MKEDKDRLMDGLWMLYEAEGALRNISIGQFFMDNTVNYNEFYKWYKSMHHGVYQLQIDGKPDNIKATTLTAIPSKEYRVNPHVESTHEVYTSDGYNAYLYLDDKLVDIEHLSCMAHARAKFKYAQEQGSDSRADKFIDLIGRLYTFEEDYKRDKLSLEK